MEHMFMWLEAVGSDTMQKWVLLDFSIFDSQFRAWTSPSSPSSRCPEKVRIYNQKKVQCHLSEKALSVRVHTHTHTHTPPLSLFVCGCEFTDFFLERKLFPVVWLHARPPPCSSPGQSRRFTAGMCRKHEQPLAAWWDGCLENNGRAAWTAFPHLKICAENIICCLFSFPGKSRGEVKDLVRASLWKKWASEQGIDQRAGAERCSNIYPEHFAERCPAGAPRWPGRLLAPRPPDSEGHSSLGCPTPPPAPCQPSLGRCFMNCVSAHVWASSRNAVFLRSRIRTGAWGAGTLHPRNAGAHVLGRDCGWPAGPPGTQAAS